jgi:hypothetical protein
MSTSGSMILLGLRQLIVFVEFQYVKERWWDGRGGDLEKYACFDIFLQEIIYA